MYLTGGGSPKKEWQAADDTELEAAQPESPDVSLLIRKSILHPRNPSARQLVHVDRSQKRISPHTDSPQLTHLPWLRMSRKLVAVQGSTIWPGGQPLGIHQDNERSSKIHSNQDGRLRNILCRRLVVDGIGTRRVQPIHQLRNNVFPSAITGY